MVKRRRHFQLQRARRHWCWEVVVLLFVSHVCLSACGKGSSSTQFVSTQRDFQAVFSTDILKQYGAELEFFTIDTEGQRLPLEGGTWSPESGQFSFVVRDRDFYPLDSVTPFDVLFAMGMQPPLFDPGKFARQVIGQLRVEVRPKSIPNGHALVPYTQFILPLSRESSLNSSETMILESGVALEVVGASRARIIDAEGKALEQAQVAIFSHGELKLSSGEPRPIWHAPLHRPVVSFTDARGYVDLMPLIENGSFQIFVQAEGYCPYLSEELVFSSKNPIAPSITMEKCEELSDDMSFQSKWVAVTTRFEDKRLDGLSYATAYTSQEVLSVDVRNTSKVLRPLRITVLEEPSEKADLCVYEGYPQTLKSFASRVSVKLPVQFYQGFCNSTTKTPTGSFTIKLEALSETGEVVHSHLLYGKKSTATPATVEASKTSLTNPLGVPQTISGRTGATFQLSSLILCKPRRHMGLRVEGTDDVLYSACSDNFDATFQVEKLKIPDANLGRAQNIGLEVFIKDEYGNVSGNDQSLSRLNLLSNVFVDYGVPDLEEIRGRFTTHFGIAAKTMAAGQLPAGTFPNQTATTTDTAILTPATLSNFVFRFESPASCETVGSDADGTGTPRPGATIRSFVFGPTAAAVNSVDVQNFQTCAQNGTARDYTLKSGDLVFPSNSNAALEFFLRAADQAGNVSAATSFTIPPCPAAIETVPTNPRTPVCWRP